MLFRSVTVSTKLDDQTVNVCTIYRSSNSDLSNNNELVQLINKACSVASDKIFDETSTILMLTGTHALSNRLTLHISSLIVYKLISLMWWIQPEQEGLRILISSI